MVIFEKILLPDFYKLCSDVFLMRKLLVTLILLNLSITKNAVFIGW